MIVGKGGIKKMAECKECLVLKQALRESIKYQSHYAELLNHQDGGHRIIFKNMEQWMDRLEKLKKKEGIKKMNYEQKLVWYSVFGSAFAREMNDNLGSRYSTFAECTSKKGRFTKWKKEIEQKKLIANEIADQAILCMFPDSEFAEIIRIQADKSGTD